MHDDCVPSFFRLIVLLLVALVLTCLPLHREWYPFYPLWALLPFIAIVPGPWWLIPMALLAGLLQDYLLVTPLGLHAATLLMGVWMCWWIKQKWGAWLNMPTYWAECVTIAFYLLCYSFLSQLFDYPVALYDSVMTGVITCLAWLVVRSIHWLVPTRSA